MRLSINSRYTFSRSLRRLRTSTLVTALSILQVTGCCVVSTLPVTLLLTTSNSASVKLRSKLNYSANQAFTPACKKTHLHTYPITKWTNANIIFSDGRDVTSDAQLWAVPDEILPREPAVRTSEVKMPRALFAKQKRAQCDTGHGCDEAADCYEWNCARCVRDPPVGCPSFCPTTPPRCAFDR
jgi:hypothetical protein